MPEVYGIVENLEKIKTKLKGKYDAKKLVEYLNNNITKFENQDNLNNNNTPKIKPMDFYLGRYSEDKYIENHGKRNFIVQTVIRAMENKFCDDDSDYNRGIFGPEHELTSFPPNNYVIIKVTFDNAPFIKMSDDEKMLEWFFLITQSDPDEAHFNTFLDNLDEDPLFTNAASAANAGGSYRRTRIRRRKNRMSRRKRTARRKH